MAVESGRASADATVNVTVAHGGCDAPTDANSGGVTLANGTGSVTWTTPISAGDTETIGYDPGDTVRIIRTGPSNRTSATLGERTAPGA